MKRIATLTALAAMATLTAGTASAANLISNGGFEDGTLTDADNWQQVAQSPTRDNTNPNSGSWALKLEATGSDQAGAASVAVQNNIDDGGQAGLAELSTVDISFQYESANGPGGVVFAAGRILDSGGNIVADTGLVNLGNNSGYTLVNLPTLNVPAFGAPPADEYAVFIEFTAQAGAFDGSFGGGYIDDVVAEGTFVPEPTSLALLGLGGLLAFRRRRQA